MTLTVPRDSATTIVRFTTGVGRGRRGGGRGRSGRRRRRLLHRHGADHPHRGARHAGSFHLERLLAGLEVHRHGELAFGAGARLPRRPRRCGRRRPSRTDAAVPRSSTVVGVRRRAGRGRRDRRRAACRPRTRRRRSAGPIGRENAALIGRRCTGPAGMRSAPGCPRGARSTSVSPPRFVERRVDRVPARRAVSNRQSSLPSTFPPRLRGRRLAVAAGVVRRRSSCATAACRPSRSSGRRALLRAIVTCSNSAVLFGRRRRPRRSTRRRCCAELPVIVVLRTTTVPPLKFKRPPASDRRPRVVVDQAAVDR